MNKQSYWTILAMLLLTMLLAACGGGSAEPVATQGEEETGSETSGETAEEPESTSGESEVTELQLMGWASSEAENDRLQEVIDEFNANNPDLNVTLNLVPDYDTKLQTSLAGGSPPDVFYIDSFRLPDFVAADSIEPAEGQLENVDDFYPSLREAFTIDDTLYCPPKDFSTLGLQYNKALFDAAGVEYPTNDWTWDDLRAAAEQLTDEENGVYGMVVSADFARWIAFLYQAGGSVTNSDFTEMTINSPEAMEAMNFYVGLVEDGFAATPAGLDSGWPGEAFGKESAAMSMEGNWIASFLNDQFPDVDYGVVQLPAGPAGEATMAFTVCYGVPAIGENKEASFRLVNYLTGPEGMKRWTDLGLAMPTRASLADGWTAQYPELEPFLAGAENANPWQFRPGFQDVLDTMNDGLQQAFSGTLLSEDVLSNTEEVGTEVLNR